MTLSTLTLQRVRTNCGRSKRIQRLNRERRGEKLRPSNTKDTRLIIMKGRLTEELCFSVPTAYDDMRGFSKKRRDFLDPTRFVAFKKNQTFDPLSDDRQCVSLVSDAIRPTGTRLSWENVHCYQPPDTDFIKYGNPNSDDEACDNLGYRRHPRHIYWLRTARDLGDLLGRLGEPGYTSREQLDEYFATMRRTRSKALTNHNRGVVNLFPHEIFMT
jgi:hypothetical protein